MADDEPTPSQLASFRHELHRLANAIASRDAALMLIGDRLDAIEAQLRELAQLVPQLVRIPPTTPPAA